MAKRLRPGIYYCMVIVILMAGGLSGCLKSSVNENTNSVGSNAFISAMNLAFYSSPSIQIYLNDNVLTNPMAPGSYSQTYFSITPGIYDTQFKTVGSTVSSDSVLSDIPSSEYDSSGFYTLILFNSTIGGAAESVKIKDDFSTVSSTNSNYRFFNMCPDAPVVDLYFNTKIVQAARSVADNVTNTGYNAFQQVTPGTYTIQAKKAGTDSVVASVSNYTLSTQTAFTIFLSGKPTTASPNIPASSISINVLRASY
jgi:Domain of unknown function (DUF4397)